MTVNASTPTLVDTHCHLTDPVFANDLREVLACAQSQGVRRIVNIGTTLQDSRAGRELAQTLPQMYASVGIHPNHSHLQAEDYLQQLESIARDPKVVALGEIGLDYHWNRSPKEKQVRVFQEQLELAAQAGLPVVIHCREAMADVLKCLDGWIHSSSYVGSPLALRPYAGILHSFSGDENDARKAREMNFLLGLGGPVTFKNAKALHALVPRLGLANLILETDAPYLSPHPYRGKRNEPSRVSLIGNRIAQLMGISFEEVAVRTTANALSIFGWQPF